MHRFFVLPEQIGGTVVLIGEDAKHAASVLRVRVGENIVICDGQGMDYVCEVQGVTKSTVAAQVLEKQANTAEGRLKITVYQGLPKGDKFEQITQKTIELGAYAVVPVVCQRSITKADNAASKLARWRKIAEAAAKQSHRGIIPVISEFATFAKAIEAAQRLDVAIACHVGEGLASLRSFLQGAGLSKAESIGLFIGPEGGFADEEIVAFAAAGIRPVSLGPSVLRTETAAVVAIANIQYELSDEV